MALAQSVATQPAKRHSALGLMTNPKGIWNFLRAKNAPRTAKVAALLAAVYIVCPVDFIPDIAPVLGWLDDLGMAGIALAFIARQAALYGDFGPEQNPGQTPARVHARVTPTR